MYHRVLGSGFGAVGGGRQEIWAEADHFLLVSRQGFVETYKRFYFRDIQALVIQRTASSLATTIGYTALTAFTAILLGIGTLTQWMPAALASIFCCAVVLLAALIAHMLRGPSCRCWIQTAIQTVPVDAVQRLPAARRLREIIRATVEPIQGTLPPDEILRIAAEREARPPSPLDSTPVHTPTPWQFAHPPRDPQPPTKPRHSNGQAHRMLFITLLVDAIHTAVCLFWHGALLIFLSFVMFFAIATGLILALVLQSGSDLPRRIRTFTWTTLIYFLLLLALSGIHATITSLSGSYSYEAHTFWAARSIHSPFELAMNLFSFGFSACIGVLGLLRLRQFRLAHATPPAMAATPIPPAVPGKPAMELPSPEPPPPFTPPPPPPNTTRDTPEHP